MSGSDRTTYVAIGSAPRDGRTINGMWKARGPQIGFGKVKWSNAQNGWVGASDCLASGVLVNPTHWAPNVD